MKTTSHGKSDSHSPRRKSITDQSHNDTTDHPNTQGKTRTHGNVHAHGTRRKSDAHEQTKDTHNEVLLEKNQLNYNEYTGRFILILNRFLFYLLPTV